MRIAGEGKRPFISVQHRIWSYKNKRVDADSSSLSAASECVRSGFNGETLMKSLTLIESLCQTDEDFWSLLCSLLLYYLFFKKTVVILIFYFFSCPNW